MLPLTLVIGGKNYSSRSLRPCLLLRRGHSFRTTVRILLYRPELALTLAP